MSKIISVVLCTVFSLSMAAYAGIGGIGATVTADTNPPAANTSAVAENAGYDTRKPLTIMRFKLWQRYTYYPLSIQTAFQKSEEASAFNAQYDLISYAPQRMQYMAYKTQDDYKEWSEKNVEQALWEMMTVGIDKSRVNVSYREGGSKDQEIMIYVK